MNKDMFIMSLVKGVNTNHSRLIYKECLDSELHQKTINGDS